MTDKNEVGKNDSIRLTRSKISKLGIDIETQTSVNSLKSSKRRKLNDKAVGQSDVTGKHYENDETEGFLSNQQAHTWNAEDFLAAITKVLTKKYCDVGARLGLKRIPKCLLNVDNCSKFHHRQTVSI